MHAEQKFRQWWSILNRDDAFPARVRLRPFNCSPSQCIHSQRKVNSLLKLGYCGSSQIDAGSHVQIEHPRLLYLGAVAIVWVFNPLRTVLSIVQNFQAFPAEVRLRPVDRWPWRLSPSGGSAIVHRDDRCMYSQEKVDYIRPVNRSPCMTVHSQCIVDYCWSTMHAVLVRLIYKTYTIIQLFRRLTVSN